MFRTFLIIAFSAGLVGCGNIHEDNQAKVIGRDEETGRRIFPLSKTVVDDRPDLKFHADKPFRFVFGRGSGLYGLETIAIDESLKAELFRQTQSGWETCTVALDLDEWGAITDSITRNRIYSLNRQYHARVQDGEQWVFWSTQDGTSKTIYCNNYFPKSLQEFANDVDRVFDIDDELMGWTAVAPGSEGDHDQAIWAAIR